MDVSGIKVLAAKIADAVTCSERGAQISARVASNCEEIVVKARQVDELVAGEEFTSAVKALAAGELDPYQAAESLLAE